MNISEYLKYSIFSDLAYVEWNDSNQTGQSAIDAAVKYKRAPAMLGAKIFDEDHWEVADYCPNTDTGFKASLYSNGQEKILAICGTEPNLQGGLDLLKADIGEIGRYGVSIAQAADMYNYIMRLITREDQDVVQLKFNSSTSILRSKNKAS